MAEASREGGGGGQAPGVSPASSRPGAQGHVSGLGQELPWSPKAARSQQLRAGTLGLDGLGLNASSVPSQLGELKQVT